MQFLKKKKRKKNTANQTTFLPISSENCCVIFFPLNLLNKYAHILPVCLLQKVQSICTAERMKDLLLKGTKRVCNRILASSQTACRQIQR